LAAQGRFGANLIQAPSFTRHRFSGEVIRYAVWLYFRFTLSVRDVEELLAQRGIVVSPLGDPLLGDQARPTDRGEHPAGAVSPKRTCLWLGEVRPTRSWLKP